MKENSIEKKNFIDFIKLELGKTMPVQEAVQKLADYHRASTQNVLNAFFNFGIAKEDDVAIFSETVNSSVSCVSVETRNHEGNWKSSSKIDKYTGQPMATVG